MANTHAPKAKLDRDTLEAALLSAAWRNSTDTIEKLLNVPAPHTPDINCRAKDDFAGTPLYRAVCAKADDAVKLLLQKGADVNAGDKNDTSPLQAAVAVGSRSTVELLLATKPDINKANTDGCRPLYTACLRGHSDLAELLLAHRPDVNAQTKDGASALMAASLRGLLPVAQQLLDANANVNTPNQHGFAALALACQASHVEIVQLLLNSLADVNAVENDGNTPLAIASRNGNDMIVHKLVESGAIVNQANSQNVTPLGWAIMKGHFAVVKYLLENGADLKITQTTTGYTPLMLAVTEGSKSEHCAAIVKLLLDQKADVNAKSADGQSALQLAEKSENAELVNIIKESTFKPLPMSVVPASEIDKPVQSVYHPPKDQIGSRMKHEQPSTGMLECLRVVESPFGPSSEAEQNSSPPVSLTGANTSNSNGLALSAAEHYSSAADAGEYDKWTVDNVCQYLLAMDVDKDAVEVIRRQKIRGRDLLEITNDDLKDAGIVAIGDRKDIQRAIKSLTGAVANASTVLLHDADVVLADRLSRGNFGEVFRGTYRGANVVIKKPNTTSKNMLDDFFEEAKLMKSIPPHPNVVQYFGVCSTDQELLLVIEFCPHGSLEDYLRKNPTLPVETRVHIATEVAAGMAHLSAFIVHRDLATRNILLSPAMPPHDVMAKVADFGLARALSDHGYYRLTMRHPLPLPWCPNEIYENRGLPPGQHKPHTVASDVWMFATTVWELFSKIPSDEHCVPDPERSKVPPLSQPAIMPDNVYALLTRCWAIDPLQRPSFQTVHAELVSLQ